MKISAKQLYLYVLTDAKGALIAAVTTLGACQTLQSASKALKMDRKPLRSATAGSVAGVLLSSTNGAARGGAARSKNLTPERRREIAQKANAARWGK